MRVEKFVADRSTRIALLIQDKCGLSYNFVQKVLRSKDVKINGSRVSKDVSVNVGDEVWVYLADEVGKVDVLFEDENIVVVFKKRQIETVSDDGNDLLSKVCSQLNKQCYAVHRLDRNTEGLVVFAKNLKAKASLDLAFKNRTIEKKYLALVYGMINSDTYSAYLKKDSHNSLVYISDCELPKYEKIITKVRVLKSSEELSLIEVDLVTGKTHQIRAHLAHLGSFVLGDEKYGNSKINKTFKKKFQCLCAYKIKFKFSKGDFLENLNGKIVSIDKSKIDFCKIM